MFDKYDAGVLQALSTIAEPKSVSNLSEPVERLVSSLGFGGYSFGIVWGEDALTKGTAELVGGNLAPVVTAYLEAEMTAHDPVVQQLRRTRKPVLWSRFLRGALRPDSTDEHLARIARLLAGNGISAGATIPVDVAGAGCRAALAVSSAPGMDMDGFDTRFAETGWILRLAALSLGHNLGPSLIAKARTALSSSETLVLKALSMGMRPREIAERLGKSEHTIRNQIVSAQQRLGATTKEQAVARALQFGLLD